MREHDDFPLSPDCWADASAFYEAFLKAEEFLASVPARNRGANPDRTLHELASHLYISRSQPNALLRARTGVAEATAAVWLSRVRVISEWFFAANDVPAFSKLDAVELRVLAEISADISCLAELTSALLARGIILIHERSIPGMKVDGAVFKLTSGNPVVGISLRYPRLDHYWFTLMHELAHIVLHDDLLSSPIIDDLDSERPDLVERQADKLASDSLIPRNEWRSCSAKYTLSEGDVRAFANKLKIAPQIVAGRLRRELRRHDLFSDLIHKVNIREVLLGED
jgi:HTH-type transcriptional regulator/antitoxin HigA